MSFVPEKALVVSNKQLTADTVLLRVKSKISYLPGQFAQLSLPGIGECPVSFCSYSGGFVEFAVRDAGGVTGCLCRLKKGDFVWVRGPFGHGFPLAGLAGRNLVLVGGGTGVAPLRSVVHYVLNGRKSLFGLQLFFGFKGYDDIIFRDDFDRWRLSCDVRLSLDNPCRHLKCFAGFVTDLIKRHRVEKNSVAFICGPPAMTRFAVQALMAKGLSEKDIFVSMERLMQCGTGKCGHCMVNDKYVCKDGPVFRADVAGALRD